MPIRLGGSERKPRKTETWSSRARVFERRKATRKKQRPAASFANHQGRWVLRVTGDASEGDSLSVRKKDGSSETKTLGRLISDRGDYALYEVGRDSGRRRR